MPCKLALDVSENSLEIIETRNPQEENGYGENSMEEAGSIQGYHLPLERHLWILNHQNGESRGDD